LPRLVAEVMTSPMERPAVTWEGILYRSATDAAFRESLLRDATGVLRELRVVAGDETVIVHEWRTDERILIVPPLADTSTERLQQHARSSRGVAKAARADGAAGESYSKEPPSAPIAGPAVAALGYSGARSHPR
jgi:hypothetical protein